MSGLLGTWQSSDPNAWPVMMADVDTHWGGDGIGDWCSAGGLLRLGRSQRFNTPESALEPPVLRSEGCVLVWDGRLDDRESLLAGRRVVTDGQLLVEGYRRWGLDCLNRLIGDYSFVLWDEVAHQLVAGCDSLGSRPLAYYWNGRSLLISSRVLSLLHHANVNRRLDPLYLAHTLCDRWSHPPGLTAFADIKRLRPGWALILKDEKLTVKPVAPLGEAVGERLPQQQAEAQDEFWHLLNKAIKDRCRSHHPACTTLSGGLDSTTITAGLLQQLDTVEAFSNITTVFKEFDERQPIQSFLSAFPQVKWHSVNGDRAWPFGTNWADLPVPDDPLVACTMSMNVQMMRQMRQFGFGTAFDGAWGDELFDSNLYDLLANRCWASAWKHMRQAPRWQSWLWHSWVLPRLTSPLQRWWLDRKVKERSPDILPSWLQTDYSQTSAMQTALYQIQAAELMASRQSEVASINENSAVVGSHQTYRLFQASCGIEMVSPFGDKRLVRFANSLDPTLQNDLNYNKIFLRRAIQSNMPQDITWRHKTNHFAPLLYAGLASGSEVSTIYKSLSDSLEMDCILDKEMLNNALSDFQKKHKNPSSSHQVSYRDAGQLYATTVLLYWRSYINLI